MEIILLHNHYNKEHLETVKAEMLKLGAPIIRVVKTDYNDLFVALEGCHRLRACKDLGMTPILEVLENSNDDFIGDEDTMMISSMYEMALNNNSIKFN